MKKKFMLNYILRSSLCLTAVYLVQCLRSQTAILSTPEFVITFFLLVFLIVVYRIRLSKGKKSFFLFNELGGRLLKGYMLYLPITEFSLNKYRCCDTQSGFLVWYWLGHEIDRS
uniref:Uncharacterized protein n=1 Tax=Ammopiptanthus mongolicus TaxID=126911 RepID=A0A4P8PFI1_AMMMO|nr:hypothetical protein [Ammopiptanthus mongolicus]